MSDFEFGQNLKLLSELLNPKRDEDESDEELISGNTYKTPADFHLQNEGNVQSASASNKKEVDTAKDEEFCQDEHEEKLSDFDTTNTWKKTPEWDVSYKQSVSASDVFLQMGPKNPATASCENMVIKVKLPGESRYNVDLKVLKTTLELNSPNFYLKTPLPHRVNPQLGNALFDSEAQQLIITLVMDRELDFVNF